MDLQLQRPICFFDIEATGTHVVRDRIVEIAILKIQPNGNRESRSWLVNPTIPIPAEVVEIHGIDDEKIKDEPTFKELAHHIYDMVKDSDVAGYNSNKFDIPMLAEEFLRCDIEWDLSKRHAVDVQNIFHRMEQRTLEAAYRFYCQKDLQNAHSAGADTAATYEILKAQLDRYDELENDIAFLSEFSNRQKVADYAGFIAFNKEGREVFTFGKYKNREVEDVLHKDPGYYGWILKSEFPLYTKKVLTAIKLRAAKL